MPGKELRIPAIDASNRNHVTELSSLMPNCGAAFGMVSVTCVPIGIDAGTNRGDIQPIGGRLSVTARRNQT